MEPYFYTLSSVSAAGSKFCWWRYQKKGRFSVGTVVWYTSALWWHHTKSGNVVFCFVEKTSRQMPRHKKNLGEDTGAYKNWDATVRYTTAWWWHWTKSGDQRHVFFENWIRECRTKRCSIYRNKMEQWACLKERCEWSVRYNVLHYPRSFLDEGLQQWSLYLPHMKTFWTQKWI